MEKSVDHRVSMNFADGNTNGNTTNVSVSHIMFVHAIDNFSVMIQMMKMLKTIIFLPVLRIQLA